MMIAFAQTAIAALLNMFNRSIFLKNGEASRDEDASLNFRLNFSFSVWKVFGSWIRASMHHRQCYVMPLFSEKGCNMRSRARLDPIHSHWNRGYVE